MKIKESKLICNIAPHKGNPRNSEGSFLKLDDGRIIFAYSRYIGNSAGDHADCCVSAVYSYDNGESFEIEDEKNHILARASEYGETNVMSVSLARMQNGDGALVYLLKRKGLTSDIILRRTNDNFASFYEETKIAPKQFPAYYVINNDRVAITSKGRIYIPAAKHSSSVFPREDGYVTFDGRSQCVFFVSDDDGKTWKHDRALISLPHGSYTNSGLQEPGLVELKNGVLYAYFRTDLMQHYESVSIDDGKHWWDAQPSRFTGPCSPLLIKKNEYSNKYYAVWNPAPEYQTRPEAAVWTGGRTPLVIAESDDGYNFGEPVIIEADDERGFCYPAMMFLDEKTVLLAYCSGGTEEGGCLNRTTIRKLILE